MELAREAFQRLGYQPRFENIVWEDKDELLGASINRIENNRIKTLAQRSAWIGNDETHYARKHEDLGLSEMKRFIKAMLTYVESELAFEEAESISRK